MITRNAALDWPALLEPRADAAAGHMLREMAAQRFPWVAAEPRAGDSLAARRADEATLLPPPRYALAPAAHPNIAAAERYLARWPEAAAECRALLDGIEFYIDTTLAPGMGAMTPGSSSHSLDGSFGLIALTVDHAIGAAQAIVHETAHHKLRALGIFATQAETLIMNATEATALSPIAPHRPLSGAGLFHEAYSLLMMVELNLRLLPPEPDEIAREHILLLLARNTPKLAALCVAVDAHVTVDEDGAAMLAAFRAWVARVIATARATLRANGYGLHEIGAGV